MKMNRRKILSLLGASPAILAGASAVEAQPTKTKTLKAAGPAKIEALNPRGNPPPITLIPMAPRPASLENKTVYLVSDGFPSADLFLNQIAIWFKKNMPSVTTVYRLKAGGYGDDDPKLRAEIKEKGQAVIMAIGH